MMFNEAIENYTKYVEVTKSKGTLKFLKGKTGILYKYLGDFNCNKIDKNVILNFIIDQRVRNSKISNTTLNYYIGLIKRILKSECEINLEFTKLSQTCKIVPIIPEEDIKRIFNHFQRHLYNRYSFRNYVFLRLLYDSGLRINEILNIKVDNIEFFTNSIHVKITKTNNERYVFFTDSTKNLLLSYLNKFNFKNYIFTNFKGEKWTYEGVKQVLKRAAKRLDIKCSVSPHKWRHSFATRFIKNNGDLETLRLILGHTSLRTTQRYLHLDKDNLEMMYRNALNS